MWRWLAVGGATLGCGRIGFDERALPALVATTHVKSGSAAVVSVPDVAAGSANLLVAIVIAYESTTSVMGVDDDFGNTYTNTGATSISPTVSTSIWYAANSVAGSGTLTVTLDAATGASVWFDEFTGVDSLDGIGDNGAGVIMPTIDSPSAQVRGNDELAISVLEMTAGEIDGVAAPFVELPSVDGDEAAYAVVSGPTVIGAEWTASGSGTTCSSTVTFARL